MGSRNRIDSGLALCACLALCATQARAVSAVWHTDWTVESPPTLAKDRYATFSELAPYAIDFSGNGDLLMSTFTWSSFSRQVFRLSTEGTLNWSAALLIADGNEAGPILAAADGGAYVASEIFNVVSRLGADGDLVWARRVPARWLAELPGSALVAASCQVITSLRPDGQVNWQRRLSFPQARCAMSGFEATANGSIHASVQIDSYSAADSTRILKYDDHGNLAWQIDMPDPDARLLGVDSGRVYVATPTRLSALDSKSGALLWQSIPQVSEFFLVRSNPGRPIAVAGGAVIGFSPTTGDADWSTPSAVSGHADALGDSILVATEAGLMRIRAVDGSQAWIGTLPLTDASGHPVNRWLRFGGLDDDRFLAVAEVSAPASQPAPLIQLIDFSTGQSLEPIAVPDTLQGVEAEMVLDDAEIYSIVTEQNPVATRYRLRSVNSIDGVENWSRVEPLFDPPSNGDYFRAGAGQMSAAHGRVVAVLGERGDSATNIAMSTWESATGLPLWLAVLSPTDEIWRSTALSSPLIDVDGNVLVSLATYVECVYPDICASYQLRKLAATTGAEVWRHEFNLTTQMEPPYLRIPAFALLGDDVVLDGSNNQVARLDATSGAVVWSAEIPEFGSVFWMQATNEGDILIYGFMRWGKLDGTSGNVLWSWPSPAYSCFPYHCSNPVTLELPDGDLFQVATRFDGIGYSEAMVIVLHTDGSGSYERWFPASDLAGNPRITEFKVDAQGEIWMQLRESRTRGRFAARWLTRFDRVTGLFVGRQALGISPANLLGSTVTPFRWLAAPTYDRLLTGIYTRDTRIGQTPGVGLLDVAVAAHGNLSIEANLPQGPIMAGEIIPFNVTATYAGDLSIDNVQIRIAVPWGGPVSELSCSSEDEGSCVIDMRDGDLHLELDMQPASEFSIRGMVQALDGDEPEPALMAVVQGPTTLIEVDSADNMVTASTRQALFHDGFDNPMSR